MPKVCLLKSDSLPRPVSVPSEENNQQSIDILRKITSFEVYWNENL